MPWGGWADRLFPSAAWTQAAFWALDIETSGLDPKRDRILSVGMVPIREGSIRWGERFYSLVRPPDPRALSAEGIRAHHILPSELEDAPPLATVLPEVDRRIRDAVLLVHHAPMDVVFLKEAYRATAIAWPRPRVVDTEALALVLHRKRYALEPHPPAPVTALHRLRSELDFPPHLRHHALMDALATAELFLALRHRLGALSVRQLVQ